MPGLIVARTRIGAVAGGGSGALVQSNQDGGGTDSSNATSLLGASPSAGNQRIVIATCRNGGPRLSMTSPASGFTALFSEVINHVNGELLAWRRTVVGGDGTGVTVHSSGGDFPNVFDIEVSGVSAVTDAFTNQTGIGVTTNSPAVTGTPTPSSGGVFVIEAFFCGWGDNVPGTLTKGTGWTQLFKKDGTNFEPQWLIQYGSFAYNAIPVSGVAASVATGFAGTRIIMQ